MRSGSSSSENESSQRAINTKFTDDKFLKAVSSDNQNEFSEAPDKLSDEDFDMKGTSRKEYENEYYKRICSEVIEDFLYLGSDFMARDKSMF